MRTAIAEKAANNLKIMVAQTVTEILNDPDFRLELSAKAQKRLRQAARAEKKTTALSAIKRKHL
jgi:F0F1-type ATP synthase epsilon subunit